MNARLMECLQIFIDEARAEGWAVSIRRSIDIPEPVRIDDHPSGDALKAVLAEQDADYRRNLDRAIFTIDLRKARP